MTTACGVWMAADFLARNDYEVTFRADGRVTAARDGITVLVPGVCGHDPADCPPLTPAQTIRLEAAA
ncbi:hypothetical protein [Micromonospora carbonacea]|uniref:Uncharacterized protein n=1 Tax=Micromonospora carbonacea TaxID=47853 RepID=A0A1C5ACF2_9ACTN|nr:hypothetical protein [Micromonospora carbonacea]SCF42907.1 hypothetical protein GA0070563_112153 [Micromonospora carbonacea]